MLSGSYLASLPRLLPADYRTTSVCHNYLPRNNTSETTNAFRAGPGLAQTPEKTLQSGMGPDSAINFSVIIPMLNEADHISAAVRSAWEAGAQEVIAVDGGSGDGSLELAHDGGARVLRGVSGRGPQQNQGAAAASGKTLLFLHADCRLPPAAGVQLASALSDPAVLGGGFAQSIAADGLKYRLLERGNTARVRWFSVPYGDQAIFIRRDTFESLGGFADVPLMEDVQLMHKLRRHARPVLLPGPVVVSPRRWERHGVVAQTLRNWSLLTAWRLGVSPHRLAEFYR